MSAIDYLTRNARRRLLLAYLSRESAWRALVILLAVLPGLLIRPWWLISAIAAGAMAMHWIIRWRAPSALAAAIEVDRQFSLQELISTGLLAREGDADPLICAARHQANLAAGKINPARLNPGHFGLPYWIAALILFGVLFAIPASPVADVLLSSGTRTARVDIKTQPPEPPQGQPFLASAKTLARPAGDAARDFASSIGDSGDSASRQPAGQRPRGDSDSRSAGGGLATGGSATSPQPSPSLASSPPGPEGAGSASAGAGRSLSATGSASGTGTITRDPPKPSSDLSPGPVAPSPGSAAAPDPQLVPSRYRELVKAFYTR